MASSGIRIVEEYAAKQVAGSTFRIMANGKTILHECGATYSKGQTKGFPFDVREVFCLGLGHAHADHMGRLPELFRAGFNGKIYATQTTAALANLQLKQDSAGAFFYNKRIMGKRIPGTNDFIPFKESFKSADIQKMMEMFESESGKPGISYEREVEIAPGIKIKFYEAGHIPGSAQTMYMIDENGRKTNMLLAYDLGRTDYKILGHPVNDTPFVRFPATKFGEKVDYVVVEATYGDREHKPLEQSLGNLESTIKEVEKTKGVLLAPAFSIMRTQMFRDFLFRFDNEGKLPGDMMIYTSSPGADDVDKIMLANMGDLDARAIEELRTPNRSSFCWDKYVRHKKVDETMKVIEERIGKAPTIVIASSGMCDMGRAVQLSRAVIGDERNIVLKLGYASHGSRMDIMSKAKKGDEIRYDDGSVKLEARVMEMGGLSGHADWKETEAQLRNMNDPNKGETFKAIFVKHGEEKACYALAEKLKEARNAGENIIVMEPGQVYGHKSE